jgi:hypothetical protein
MNSDPGFNGLSMTKLGRIDTHKKAGPGEIVERRRVRRVSLDIPVRLRLADVDVGYHCMSVNLSMGGLYVQTRSLLSPGTQVGIELAPPDWLLPLQLRGTVVRHGTGAEAPGLGLAFDWVSEEAGDFIHRLLEDRGR